MAELKFSLLFDKFTTEKKDFNFSSGIYIIYGESGVGKSHFLNSFIPNHEYKNNNFTVDLKTSDYESFLIDQNPDNQIVCRTVKSELSFNGECIQKTPEELDTIVKGAIAQLPKTIKTDMNPGFLSGGEKELLNIITATQLERKILLIDDGLSFLSDKNKVYSLDILSNWARRNEGIIIWCTSDYDDLQFKCKGKWILNKDAMKEIISYEKKNHEFLLNPNGYLSLEIDNISFSYDNGKNVFKEFSMDILNSRCLGLIGDNGSGKTTFAGFCFKDFKPKKGSVRLHINEKEDLKIGYLDQFPENLLLLDKLFVFLNKLTDLKLFNPKNQSTFENDLHRFGIEWKNIKDFNGIEIPWVILRLSLVVMLSNCNFDVLILDEPSFGLGWNQRVLLRSFLKEGMISKHFIIISHDKKFAQSICDNIIDFDKNGISGPNVE